MPRANGAGYGTRRADREKTATLQAGFLLGAFKTRVLQEPASLARELVRQGFIEEKRRLTVAEMIQGDLSGMLDEPASLPEKIFEREWPDDETKIDLRPQVEGDGDMNFRDQG